MADTAVHPQARWGALTAYGTTGFITAAVIHAASFTDDGIAPSNPLFWIMHVAIFPLFFAFVFRLRAWQSPANGASRTDDSELQWKALLRFFPTWMPAVIAILFAYVIVNFLLSTGGASRIMVGGDGTSPTLDSARTVRAFSGHWLLFYALPTVFFLFVPADARPSGTVAQGRNAD